MWGSRVSMKSKTRILPVTHANSCLNMWQFNAVNDARYWRHKIVYLRKFKLWIGVLFVAAHCLCKVLWGFRRCPPQTSVKWKSTHTGFSVLTEVAMKIFLRGYNSMQSVENPTFRMNTSLPFRSKDKPRIKPAWNRHKVELYTTLCPRRQNSWNLHLGCMAHYIKINLLHYIQAPEELCYRNSKFLHTIGISCQLPSEDTLSLGQ
jgi:hypothetical protein